MFEGDVADMCGKISIEDGPSQVLSERATQSLKRIHGEWFDCLLMSARHNSLDHTTSTKLRPSPPSPGWCLVFSPANLLVCCRVMQRKVQALLLLMTMATKRLVQSSCHYHRIFFLIRSIEGQAERSVHRPWSKEQVVLGTLGGSKNQNMHLYWSERVFPIRYDVKEGSDPLCSISAEK